MGKYYMFSQLKTPADLQKYTLFRGTTDFTQLQQFELYESGYPYLVLVGIPKFIEEMASRDDEVKNLVESYKAVIEREFIGFDSGLTNIESETSDITNGIQTLNIITKVNAPSASTFSMTYKEKAGGVITKMHELFLRSIRDPNTTFKTYNGLIGFGDGQMDPAKFSQVGYQNECFTFLYMHTDNTGLLLEKSALLCGCQPTTANLEIYNGRKGDVTFQEIGVEFNGIPLMNERIDAKAREILNWMNSESNENQITRNSWNFNYHAISDQAKGLSQTSLIGTSSSNT